MSITDTNLAQEDFWCNLSAESIYDSADRRSKSVDSLKSVITWAFTLFSAGGAAAGLFGPAKDFSRLALILLGIGFATLAVAYSMAVKSQYPVPETFMPLVPVDIMRAFKDGVDKQAALFKTAVSTTSVGVISIAIGILVQCSGFDPMTTKNPPAPSWPAVKTGIEKQKDAWYLPVTVTTAKNDTITLELYNLKATKTVAQDSLLSREILYADTAGRVYRSLRLKPSDSLTSLTLKLRKKDSGGKDTRREQTETIQIVINK